MLVSILSTTFNQDLSDLCSFIDHQLFLIRQSDFSVQQVIVFEGSESTKFFELSSIYEQEISSSILLLILNTESQGLAACLNLGALKSKATYLMRTDTDDRMYDNRINLQISFMIDNNLDLSSMNMETPSGKLLTYGPSYAILYLATALGFNPLAHPSVCYKRSYFLIFGNYNTFLKYGEDLELWLRFLFLGHFRYGHLRQPACTYNPLPSYAKDRMNAIAQLRIRLRYVGKSFLLIPMLVLGIPINILRLILPYSFLLRLKRFLQTIYM